MLLSPSFDKINSHSNPQVDFIISDTIQFFKLEEKTLISNILFKEFNININFDEKINKSNNMKLSSILTNENKKLIEKYYKEDFYYFNYIME